jgi:hypothetical protein
VCQAIRIASRCLDVSVLSRSPGFIALSVRTVADSLSVRFDSRGLPLRLRSLGSLIASLGKFTHRVCFLGALPKTGTDKIDCQARARHHPQDA